MSQTTASERRHFKTSAEGKDLYLNRHTKRRPAGQHFTATSDEPAFIVESKKTGARAAHKGQALRSLRSNDA